jgi:hypothetical protein
MTRLKEGPFFVFCSNRGMFQFSAELRVHGRDDDDV